MFDLFKEELDGQAYSSVEEYNADVMRVGRELTEELGKVERQLLTADPEILDDLGVWVKGVNHED